MDQKEQQVLETAGQLNTYSQFLKRTLHFLVPLSLLSFLLSYSSDYPFPFSFKFHLSTLIFPLFTRTLERKYMFLICNGILGFLAKNLCLSHPSTISDPILESAKGNEEDQWKQEALVTENSNLNKRAEERESEILITEVKDTEEDDGVASSTSVIASPAEEGNEVHLNADELNKKFEEFIRKMKEDIRLEAQG